MKENSSDQRKKFETRWRELNKNPENVQWQMKLLDIESQMDAVRQSSRFDKTECIQKLRQQKNEIVRKLPREAKEYIAISRCLGSMAQIENEQVQRQHDIEKLTRELDKLGVEIERKSGKNSELYKKFRQAIDVLKSDYAITNESDEKSTLKAT